MIKPPSENKNLRAYIIGIALGDGNLSNPNGRCTRLRITCDKKYPQLIVHIKQALEKLFPRNKISIVQRKQECVDISCYSNYLEELLGWRANGGPKDRQQVSIPIWIKEDNVFKKQCLMGLFQTDGSIYYDRKYKMVALVSYIPSLANDILTIIEKLGYKANLQKLLRQNGKIKHTIRISKNASKFIEEIGLWKK